MRHANSSAVRTHRFLIHHRGDHVGVATSDIKKGETITGIYMDDESTVEIEAKDDIPFGHKIALARLEKNVPVLKYGLPIGLTSMAWEVGDYVHTHNLKTARWS